ncbi:MAG: hypothetical protein HY822_23100 [Acidobacteria bacterium]|nr:hypothetical protein [Acidobacteriota bacterium]
MVENFRSFEAGPDPSGRTWQIRFLWQQNGISIRHADTVDVKFELCCAGRQEQKVIALAHPDLLRLAEQLGRPLTDPWVSRLAATHLRRMIETGQDMEKTLVAPSFDELTAL